VRVSPTGPQHRLPIRLWPDHRGARAIAWTAVATGSVVALLLMLDGSWIRAPLERRLSTASGRAVSIESAELRWTAGPRLQLHNVSVGNRSPGEARLLIAREIGARVSVWALLRGQVELIELQLTGAELDLRRDANGRLNWERPAAAAQPSDQADDRARPLPRLPIPVGSLMLDDFTVTYRDAMRRMDLRLRADSLPSVEANAQWHTRLEFEGRYADSPFKGRAFAAPVLTLQDTAQPFPFKGQLKAGSTDVQAEGTVADLLGDMTIDARLRIAGPSLASLYPTLPLALPSTPPYRIEGRLRQQERRYRLEDIAGRIGLSDIRGTGDFDMTRARPLLTAELRSERLALADLGVLIGVDPREQGSASRVLPDKRFDVPRMRAIDADVSLAARQVAVNPAVPLEDFSVRARLLDGVLRLDPMKFGFSGGAIVSAVELDARRRPISAATSVDFRKIDFARLFPTLDRARLSDGELGAQLRLRGQGQSVAEFLASSNGTLALAMSGGRISHTVIAAASLDGGKLLPLLVRGDEPIAVRCAAIAMAVTEGVARSQVLVFDTETTRIDGSGALDLQAEQFELELRPKPKRASVLSLRAPLYVQGSFRDARVAVGPGALLRGGAALALAVVNPLAALLPLIETGPGEDSNCPQVLASVAPALDQADESTSRPPSGMRGQAGRGKKR
jgi:uncharacterized protein involved in outer membrane biogenesis